MNLRKSFCLKFINLFLLITSLAASNLIAEDFSTWSRLDDFYFQVIYKKQDSKNAISLLASLRAVAPEIQEKLGVSIQDTIYIAIAPDEKTYRQISGKNFPEWSQALAAPQENFILLKSPRFLHLDNGYEKTVIHELTHILLNKAVNQQTIPRWLNEGIAVYFSREKAFASNSLVSKALLTKSIIPLQEIENVLSFHTEKAQLAYQESYLAVRFLFEHFGDDKVRVILKNLAEGNGIQFAMYHALGISFNQFQELWLAQLQKSHRWQFLIDFDTYLWIFILLLFLLGFMLMRRRNRQKLKQWEQDEYNPFDSI